MEAQKSELLLTLLCACPCLHYIPCSYKCAACRLKSAQPCMHAKEHAPMHARSRAHTLSSCLQHLHA